ncbi:hypothetical protein EV686_11712 [Paracandidimonas soli]|uniref:Uncharacterized protein n=1 Tax=Paracandidimonas soli TaxID=1917182 RepID=A0A4R3UJ09_9BURK|nr:hypothetical protein EV686_11712 [Paracandidimonas soli]
MGITKADRSRYRQELTELGFELEQDASAFEMASAVVASGFQRKVREPYGRFFERYMRSRKNPPENRVIVPSRVRPPLSMQGVYKPKPHPRAHDIRPLNLWTPDGIGNGVERRHGYGRGS